MWNQFELQCPANDICEYPRQDKLVTEDFSNLVTILTAGAEILTADHPVWTEIKVFHNIQEKYKRTLHCDKCLQLLQRVGTCLRKMVLLNLSKTYLDLAERFLVGLQDFASVPYLPSRQQLEFVLIRTQAAAKLIFQALHYCRQTFCYLLQRLRIGHIILTLIMAASVTARVHIMFKALLIQLFDLYRKLHPWCEKLKRGAWKWPEMLELPDDLEAWLKPEESAALKPISIPKEKVDFLTTFFKKLKSKEDDSSTTSPIDLENEKPDEDCVIIEDGNSTQIEAFDIGEIISREDVRPVELNEAQDILLHKICRARFFKELKKLWDNIDIESRNSLPKKLTAKRIQFIENLLSQLKQNVTQTKKLQLEKQRKLFKIISLVQLAGFKFAKRLGLVKNEEHYLTFHVEKLKLNSPLKLVKPIKTFSELSSSVINKIETVKTISKLQDPPVNTAKSTKKLNKLPRRALQRCEAIKTVNKLRELYEEIYEELKQKNYLKKCRKLKKIYESRIHEIEQVKQNGEKETAKKLISCTSKALLMILYNL